MTLTHSVRVRILLPQPKNERIYCVLFFMNEEDSKRMEVNFVPVAQKSHEPACPQTRNPSSAATSEQVILVPIFLLNPLTK